MRGVLSVEKRDFVNLIYGQIFAFLAHFLRALDIPKINHQTLHHNLAQSIPQDIWQKTAFTEFLLMPSFNRKTQKAIKKH